MFPLTPQNDLILEVIVLLFIRDEFKLIFMENIFGLNFAVLS